MTTRKQQFIPTQLLVLDAVGCVLLGLGLAKQLRGVDLIPIEFQFQDYGLAFIAGGIALMVPALTHLVTKAGKSSVANKQVAEPAGAKPDPSSASIGNADAGKPAAVSTSRTRSLGWFAAVVTVMLVAAGMLAVNAYRAAPSSQWLTSAQLQREFDIWTRKGFYPREFEGRCEIDVEKFRADWKATPAGAMFFAYFGLSRQDYERKNREYGSSGYSVESVNQSEDCAGIDKYHAIWLKR